MHKKWILSGIAGFVIGIVVMLLTAFSAAPKLMIIENDSRYDLDQTVEMIQQNARELGWKVPTVHHLHDAVSPYGYEVGRVSVMELCQPHHAAKILAEDSAKVVTSMMPCRISVYETADGRTVISRMNTGLVAQSFGGTIAAVMAEATKENERILESVIR